MASSSSSITQQQLPVETASASHSKQKEKKQFPPYLLSRELSKKILTQMVPERRSKFDKTFNLESLTEFIGTSYRIFSEIFKNPINLERKDFSYTLVLGDTGSGKSTAIGYLLGAELRSEDGRLDYQKPDRSLPKIGHFCTETKGYSVHQNYIDTGGLFDTRGRYEDLCHAIGASIATKIFSPGRVIFVIERFELRDYFWFKKFVEKLQRILPDFEDPNILSSIIFLITKSKGVYATHDVIMANIQNVIELFSFNKENSSDCYTHLKNPPDWQKDIDYLEALKKATFIFADFLNDDTRKKIQNWEEKIGGSLTAVPLRMEEYLEGAKQAIKVINFAADYFEQLFSEKMRLSEEITTLDEKLKETESKIEKKSPLFRFADLLSDGTQEKIQNLVQNCGPSTADPSSVKLYVEGANQMITYAKKRSNHLISEKMRLREEITTLKEKLKETESDIVTYSPFSIVLNKMSVFLKTQE